MIILIHHTKPTIKVNSFNCKYEIVAVVYYNPQLILVSFPIEIDIYFQLTVFLLELLSACQRAVLHISCNIGTRHFPDMYALSPQT